MLQLSAAERRGATAIAAAALILMGSVHSSNTSWNVNSRMGTVFAVVERGTFAIDGYDEDNDALPTMDKAFFNGHHYSDKAIGVSLLGIPVYAAMQAVGALTGVEWHLQLKIYVIRMAVASVPAAIALALLWLIMTREGMPPRRAFLAVAAVFCGSWWFGYSTLAMPYAPGIAALVAAIAMLWYPVHGRLTTLSSWAIGALCGFALLCDLTFALMVAPIVVMFLMEIARYPQPTAMKFAASGAIAGAIMMVLYVGHTYLIFGKPTIPYYYIVVPLFREGTQQGFLGISWPRVGPAWFLTFHPYRGVFFWAPWMLLTLVGCVLALRRAGRARVLGVAGIWAFVAYLAMASGYYMWWGGWSMGARLMSPMLAALPLGLIEILRPGRSDAWWWSFVAASAVSIVLCLPVSFINPQVEEGNTYPRLRYAQVGDSLDVPQYRYLKMWYGGEFMFQDRVPRRLVMRFLPIGAFIVAGVLLARAAARYPSSAFTSDGDGAG
jgi:hypothetical protein